MNITSAVIVTDKGLPLVYSNISGEMLLERLMEILLPSEGGQVVATVESLTVQGETPTPRKRGRPKGSKNGVSVPKSQEEKRDKLPQDHDVCIPIGECVGTVEYYFHRRGFTEVAVWKQLASGRLHVLFISDDGEWAYGDKSPYNREGGFYARPDKIKPGSLILA